ncbi:MAG: disulfide bond formation protein B [Alphaproteobacteria bacterium]|nr:disulfide bond formation protein B [Alphaproteobacteria bacterium]
MIERILKILSCPVVVFGGLAALCVAALAAAFGSEAFLGLEPCILCVYQRWPYAIVALLSLIGLAMRKNQVAARGLIGLNGLAFLLNSVIAFYHTGVEQKWWVSKVEGCKVPSFSDKPQSILENIMSAPTANCAEIPWQDPLLGLSMANYNAIMCFGLFILCGLSFYAMRRKAQSVLSPENY